MPEVIQRRRARRDLLEAFGYLEEHASIDVADRFLTAALETYQELARMPRMGAPCSFERRPLRRLRRWPVTDFDSWLILPKRQGVEIVRVLHGARDIESILGHPASGNAT